MRTFWLLLWIGSGTVLLNVAGCVTNPETGKTAFIVTSEAEEAQLGDQAYREVLQKERLARDPRLNALIQRVGTRISSVANRPDFQWEFRLIDSKQKNAFCLPGGKVAFYTGILGVAENEAGIAAIMGHEVAHATLRHGGQRITMALGTQLGLAGLSALLGGKDSQSKQLLMAALGVGTQVGVALPFSRGNESEADEIGMRYMAKAGYDPREAPKIWERMARGEGGGVPSFLSTHPASSDRQQALTGQIPKVMPFYDASPKHGLGERL
jgi:predicted Zn-dependent protease